MNLSLGDFAALVGIISAVGVILFWSLRGRLGAVFVFRAEHDEALDRLKKIETKLETVPSRDDLTAIERTMAAVQVDIGRLMERSSSQKESSARIERQLEMLILGRLDQERERI